MRSCRVPGITVLVHAMSRKRKKTSRDLENLQRREDVPGRRSAPECVGMQVLPWQEIAEQRNEKCKVSGAIHL